MSETMVDNPDLQSIGESLASRLEALGATELAERLRTQVIAAWPADAPGNAVVQVEHWLTCARVLTAWSAIQADLRQPTHAPNGWTGVGDLVEACGEAIERFSERKNGVWLIRCLTLPLLAAQDQTAIEETVQLLGRCRDVLQPLDDSSVSLFVVPACDAVVSEQTAQLDQALQGDDVAKLLTEKATGRPDDLVDRMWARRSKIADAIKPAEARLGGHPELWPAVAILSLAAESLGKNSPKDVLLWLRGWAEKVLSNTDRKVELVRGKTDESLVFRLAKTSTSAAYPLYSFVSPRRPARPPLLDAAGRLKEWLSNVQRDAPLADACGKWVESLEITEGDGAAWWAAADYTEKALLWRLVQRLDLLMDEQPPAVTDFFTVLEEAGFWLTTETDRAKVMIKAPWFVSTASVGPAVRVGPILRGPDDSTLGPAVWLRRAETAPADHPLLDALSRAEPLLTQLRLLMPDWPGWDALNRTQWSAAEGGDDVEAARQALEIFFHARATTKAKDRDSGTLFATLARLFANCLTGPLRTTLFPTLDPKSVWPTLLTEVPTPEQARLKCQTSDDRPRGYVLSVRHFGVNGSQADLVVSCGSTVSAELSGWLDLPEPPIENQSHPLRLWYEMVQRLPLYEPAQVEQHQANALARWQQWLPTPEGLDDFGQFAVRAKTDAAARAWIDALRDNHWVRFAPVPDADDRPGWPPALAAAERIEALARSRAPAGEMLRKTAAAELLGQPLDAVALVEPLLAEAANLEGEPELLAALRQWCGAHGLTVWPDAGAAVSESPKLAVLYSFDEREAGQTLRVERYGLCRGKEVVAPGRAIVSAGRSPEGYDRLTNQIEEVGAPELHDDLKTTALHPYTTPEARQKCASEFYLRACKTLSNLEPSQSLADLNALLIDFLEKWAEVVPYYPVEGAPPQDNWEVIQVGKGHRVQRVIRPGLRDKQGRTLQVPYVEVG